MWDVGLMEWMLFRFLYSAYRIDWVLAVLICLLSGCRVLWAGSAVMFSCCFGVGRDAWLGTRWVRTAVICAYAVYFILF